MPSMEWFDEQDEAYRESVLPASVTARVSVEAGIAMPWHRFLGAHGRAVSLEHYGASADAKTLFRDFGFTAEADRKSTRLNSSHVATSYAVFSFDKTTYSQ